jgi:diguanylate cyclase (GGDEF)-like protein
VSGVSAARHKRQLDALLQVGTAASTVLEPTAVARVALDEILRILGAERAHLFLRAGDGNRLNAGIGRDADGNDLAEITGYSSTVVERVRLSGEPVVVTGTEDGAELGSQSAVAHGLRSIMAVPLRFDDRLLGVIYLDSRLARGVFTTDDVEILGAIAGHVAVSLQTARAAELEREVHAERRQRTLAESLRACLATVSGTLEPAEVLDRLLHAAGELIHYDAACILLAGADGGFTTAAVAGSIDRDRALGRRMTAQQEPIIAAVLRPDAGATVIQPDPQTSGPLAELLGPAKYWIYAPLLVRGTITGLVVLADTRGTPGDSVAQIAAALAAQGAVAYDNAMLFSDVQRLATIDDLSGISNRREFFQRAGGLFAGALRNVTPLAAIMVDVDHFKRINDQYGHHVGDEVIRAVSQRLSEVVWHDDVVGRYGGEEFAAVVRSDLTGALDCAERIRAGMATRPVQTSAGPVSVTVSVGVAVLAPGDADLETVLNRADQALYGAKRDGRNRVAWAAGDVADVPAE